MSVEKDSSVQVDQLRERMFIALQPAYDSITRILKESQSHYELFTENDNMDRIIKLRYEKVPRTVAQEIALKLLESFYFSKYEFSFTFPPAFKECRFEVKTKS